MAVWRTRAWPCVGSPTSTSSHWRTAGPPVWYRRIALGMARTPLSNRVVVALVGGIDAPEALLQGALGQGLGLVLRPSRRQGRPLHPLGRLKPAAITSARPVLSPATTPASPLQAARGSRAAGSRGH